MDTRCNSQRGKTMTPKQLQLAGRELFGEQWQTPLADALKYQPRQIRRFFAGDLPIPWVVYLAVCALVAERRGLISIPRR